MFFSNSQLEINIVRKITEAYYIMYLCHTVNNQMKLTSLKLFRNGVSWKNVFKLLLVSLGFY